MLTPVVQARPDGVHVVVRNQGDDEILFQWEGGGDGVGPGEERFVLPIFPGRGRSRCLPNTADIDPGRPVGWERFEVLESEGVDLAAAAMRR